jgi:hypothetical protein
MKNEKSEKVAKLLVALTQQLQDKVSRPFALPNTLNVKGCTRLVAHEQRKKTQ